MEKFDIFGTGLRVKFQGKDEYQTKVGGFVSILLSIVMVAYSS
jgi:hypothetical protein